MARVRISNVDTAWLRMEHPTNLMMISGILVLGRPLDMQTLQTTIEGALLPFRRFRQRVVAPATGMGRLYWEDDPDFDIRNNLKSVSLSTPADQTVLQAIASNLSSTPLDMSRPLWQFHLVERYGAGSAVICRLHHSIGDGLALVHVLLSMTSAEPDGPAAYTLPDGAPPPASRAAPGSFPRTRRLIGTARRMAGVLGREGMKVIAEPSHAMDLARMGGRSAKAAAVLVGRFPDPKTLLKGELGVPKRVAWSAPLPLPEVKAVGRALGGTLNDVLLSAVAGGLRRYLQGRGQQVDGLTIRAIVPVNVRKPGTEFELGNKFSLVFLSLPIGIADPLERLAEVRCCMNGLKCSAEVPVAFGILNAVGLSPERIQDIVIDIFGTKGTAVMTNVVGPRSKLYLGGAPLDAVMFWVPQSGRLGLGVSIMSYDNRVWLGVITDQGLVPDPEAIVAAYDQEFDVLAGLAREKAASRSFKAALATLDGALADLDRLIEAQHEAPPPPPARPPRAGRARPEKAAAPPAAAPQPVSGALPESDSPAAPARPALARKGQRPQVVAAPPAPSAPVGEQGPVAPPETPLSGGEPEQEVTVAPASAPATEAQGMTAPPEQAPAALLALPMPAIGGQLEWQAIASSELPAPLGAEPPVSAPPAPSGPARARKRQREKGAAAPPIPPPVGGEPIEQGATAPPASG